MLGQVVVDDQRVHAVVHEPLAHGRAGKRGEVLTGGGIGRRRRKDDGVRHRPGLLEHGDDLRDRRLLLPDRHINAIERPVGGVARRLGGAVEASLADDRVDADRRLARRPVADNQLTLTAADRNHRVNRHDAGLHRLSDRTAADDSWRKLFNRIGDIARDGPLSVQRLTQRVDDTAQQSLADGDLEELPGRAHLSALAKLRVVAEDDDADLGLVQVQCQTRDAVAEVEHLVEHDIGQPFDLGNTVADLADDADALLGSRGLGPSDFRFDFPYQVSHRSSHSRERHRRASSAARRARTLSSYTSLPTLIRIPPMSAGFSAKVASSPGP